MPACPWLFYLPRWVVGRGRGVDSGRGIVHTKRKGVRLCRAIALTKLEERL